MEDLLEAVLGFILEILAEALFEVVAAALAGLVSRGLRRFRVTLRRSNPAVAIVTFALLGVGLGFLSVFVFPHPLVHPSKLHGISLLISPVLTGLVLGLIGRSIRRRGRNPVRIESFGYGFTFALAMALVRFWLIR